MRAMTTRYLHTMYRITDPDRSRTFYEMLGLEFRRDMDIVRGGEKKQGIQPEREPYRVREGGSRICFVQDPDG
jgi:catechol 2,3-dioxygenase-like lactoylglutathione lyase family enzyme